MKNIDTLGKLAVGFLTVNTYVNACINSSCNMSGKCLMCELGRHKPETHFVGLQCYFALAAWFVGAAYIINNE